MLRSFHVAVGAVLVTCAFATSVAFAQSPAAQSQPASSPQPVCIYNSATYSDGAYVCAQKSMMLVCQVDGMKATWKTLVEKDINDRCISPAVGPVVRGNTGKRVRRHFVRAQIYPPADPKCFNFNGKRYCE